MVNHVPFWPNQILVSLAALAMLAAILLPQKLDARKRIKLKPKKPEREIFMAKPKLKAHLINPEWCKGCGICVHFCPKNVLELNDNDKVFPARSWDCICCKLCELRCPDLAIEVEIEQDEQ